MKKGFTLIELLATTVIIAIMAVIAIPAFDKFGKEADFRDQAVAMQSELEKTFALAMNPEQNQSVYQIKVETKKIDLIRNINETNPDIIESVNAPANTTLSAVSGQDILVCDKTSKDYCCISSSSSPSTCAADPNYSSQTFFTMTDSDLNQTATFKIDEKPFRVELSY